MKKKIFLTLLLLIVVSITAFSQEDADQGEKLYQLKCGRCHFAYSPQRYSLEEWKTIVQEMGSLAGLNQEKEEAILAYLGQESSKKEKDIPTSPVLGGYLYTEFFSSRASTDTFDLHYLNFNISGRLHERVSYKAEFELEHGGGGAEPPFVEQAYLDVWFSRNTALRIGAMLTPFNRFDEFHGPIENFIVTRPQMSREIGNSAWKEVGINFHGNVFFHNSFYLTYDVYAINGLGAGSRLRKSRQYKDNNDAKSLGFRLAGVIADRVEVGTSYYTGAWDDEGEYNLSMLGFHLLGKFGDFSLFAEYSRSNSENPAPFEEGVGEGYFVQVSYLFADQFRPTVRYGTLDYLDNGALLGRKPTDYDTKVLALAFNFYLTKTIVFKIEYDVIMEGDRKMAKDNNLLALQAAIRF